MNAVNLVLEIEQRFECSNLTVTFSNEMTIAQFRAELRRKGT